MSAIAGDIIGFVYERHNIKRTDFPLFDDRCTFTDDTVLTVAMADAILSHSDYGEKLKEYFKLYPGRGYGGDFRKWTAHPSSKPNNSMGNGLAMRSARLVLRSMPWTKFLKRHKKVLSQHTIIRRG